MSDKAKLILILVLVFLVFGGFTAYDMLQDYLYKNPDGTVGNAAGNLYNGGYVCQYEDKVYFANQYDGGRLYRMNADETEMERIGDVRVSNLNIDSKYIYYYVEDLATPSGMGGFTTQILGIFRMEHDGSHVKTLERIHCGVLKLVDNTLYFEKRIQGQGTTLCAYDIHSGEIETLTGYECNPASSYGKGLYYQGSEDNHYLYRYDLITGGTSVVCETNVWRPDMQGDFIYFVSLEDEYYLCRYDMASGEIQTLTTDRVDQYLVCDNYIFYQTADENAPALKMMYTDGSNQQTLLEGVYTGLGASSQAVYFYEYGTNTMYKIPLSGSMQPVVFEAAQTAALEAAE